MISMFKLKVDIVDRSERNKYKKNIKHLKLYLGVSRARGVSLLFMMEPLFVLRR